MNANGSYTCECPDGFTGDGRWPWLGLGCIGVFTIANNYYYCDWVIHTKKW